jgi:hypothetical protein
VPPMLDRPRYDLDILGQEFLLRHCPYSTRVEFCSGPVARRVTEASTVSATDLVVLSWSQDSSPGRARVIREVLDSASVPVLLIPVGVSGPQGTNSPYVSRSRT